MSEPPAIPADPTSPDRPRPELTRWKKVLMAIAVAFLIIGGALQAFGGAGDATPASGGGYAQDTGGAAPDPGDAGVNGEGGESPLAPRTLTGDDGPRIDWPPQDPDDDSPKIDWPPSGQGDGQPEQPSDQEDAPGAGTGAAGWSPFFLKGGFSFFVAFCVGYAVRVWLKLAALFLGTFFLGVFLLSYLGAIDVDWTTLEGWWNAVAARVESEATDFKTFLTGSLPQAGIASVGLLAGFKKR